MTGWSSAGDEALNRRAADQVLVEYPELRRWIVRYGSSFRQRQEVRANEGKVTSCTCGEWRRGRACWHAALVAHFHGQSLPIDPSLYGSKAR